MDAHNSRYPDVSRPLNPDPLQAPATQSSAMRTKTTVWARHLIDRQPESHQLEALSLIYEDFHSRPPRLALILNIQSFKPDIGWSIYFGGGAVSESQLPLLFCALHV